MNEQDVDKIQSTAMGLLLFEQLTLTEYRDFAYQVIELCKDYSELDAAYAQLKHQTRGVVFGDRFRAQLKQDMMDKGE